MDSIRSTNCVLILAGEKLRDYYIIVRNSNIEKRNEIYSVKARRILILKSWDTEGNLKNERKSILSKFGFDSFDELCINIRRRKVAGRARRRAQHGSVRNENRVKEGRRGWH